METRYGWTPADREQFRAWLFDSDYIARPNPPSAEDKVFVREEVCRDYLEREELEVLASPIYHANMQVCVRCGMEKLLTNFYKDSKGGRQTICKECLAKKYKEDYCKQREKKQVTMKTPPPTTKVCRECGQEKPISAFTPNYRSSDGYTNVCTECRNKKIALTYERKRTEKNPAPAVEKVPAPSLAPLDVEVERLTPEKVAVETPKVKRGAEIVAEPMTIIESPHWIRLIPDDELYAELLRRGWEGELSKQLKKRA